jgi:catechol 2,3-dioxygenase-like lactoylglutathione lyase family enzyme
MGYRLGRLIDHVDLRVQDFEASRRFYLAVFGALGRAEDVEATEDWLNLDELYVTRRAAGGAATTHIHLCFQAADRAMVERFHAEGLAAGGRDNGGPGLRDYHPGYFAAFLLDPDGNNIEAKVDERVTHRSAQSVEVQTG